MSLAPLQSASRRRFGIGLAATAAAGLTIRFQWAEAQQAAANLDLPVMIRSNPSLNAWISVAPDGAITVFTGRVELGQGCLTAMRQIAAEELDVSPASLTVISGDTALTPNEGVTSGSFAIKQGGAALGLACADAKATLIASAAE